MEKFSYTKPTITYSISIVMDVYIMPIIKEKYHFLHRKPCANVNKLTIVY